MADLKEQRVCKKFYFKMHKNATESSFVGQPKGTTEVFEWFANLQNCVMPHSQDRLVIQIGEHSDQASEGTCAQ
jgi:hypothetical protein